MPSSYGIINCPIGGLIRPFADNNHIAKKVRTRLLLCCRANTMMVAQRLLMPRSMAFPLPALRHKSRTILSLPDLCRQVPDGLGHLCCIRCMWTRCYSCVCCYRLAYQNAMKNPDKQHARIEQDKVLGRVIVSMMKADTELFKHFTDNDSFKRWMLDTVFVLTYQEPGSSCSNKLDIVRHYFTVT